MPCVAEKLPQLHEQIIGDVSQPEDSNVLTPALWAAGTHGDIGPQISSFRATQAMISCSLFPEIAHSGRDTRIAIVQ